MRDDDRLVEAKAMPIAEVAERLGIEGLVRAGVELVGPCPVCGGTDRFGINVKSGMFLCRHQCGPHSRGDQIALVQHVRSCDFRSALDWLCGPVTDQDEAERVERRRAAKARRERQDAYAARVRANTIQAARQIWFSAQPAEGSPVRDYLTLRGLSPQLLDRLPEAIRYQPDARYMVPGDQPGQYVQLHRGPAMVAAIVDASGRVTAVHRTWIDLTNPKGKLVLPDPRKPDEMLPSKKVLGHKKGGSIRLSVPRGARTLIVAEGIETTLTAMLAEAQPRGCGYWCAVDLGNMAGRMQRGPGLKYAGRPDMDDREAWVPPDWVRHLVFVQDGDSDPRLTRAKLEAGLRRAMVLRPGLRASIVHAGDGRDLNDILMGGGDE